MGFTIVTGGAGFVGSHLVDRLCASGDEVLVVDNLLTGRLSNIAAAFSSGRVTFAFADVATEANVLRPVLARAVGGRKVSAIYHLASPASPEAYGRHPWETLRVNGLGTMSLIDVALENDAKMLFCSTSEVYGDPLEHPQSESYFGNVNSVGPRACYDEGKRFGEAAVSVAAATRGLDGRIVRLFNCYGPRMGIDDGRVIPAFLAALRARKAFPIYGTGHQTRSMTYVDDIIEGLLQVMNSSLGGNVPVNLGSEEEKTVLEIGEVIAHVADCTFEPEFLPPRPEDPQRRRPSVELARSIGWQPKTSLEDGFRKTWNWYIQESVAFA